MKQVIPIEYRSSGEDLAKILIYYGLVENVYSDEVKIVCPFHDDVNPSLLCDLKEGSFFCFGCGVSGDALKFTILMEMKYPKVSELQAAKKFFKILKSKKCEKIKIKRSRKNSYSDSEKLDIAKDYYYGLKETNWKTDKREEVLKVAPYLKKRGFTRKTLTKIGAKITYNESYPVIFPMLDNGEFKGWVCRTTNKEVEKKRKYLYNEGFKRVSTLVGNYGNKKYVYVVEGFMDMLKMRQNGVHDVVAVLGWKMSEEQIQKLKDAGIEYIVSALDNDIYGRKGTKFLKQHFKVVRFAYLKGYKDPGDMSKEKFLIMNQKTIKRLQEVMEV